MQWEHLERKRLEQVCLERARVEVCLEQAVVVANRVRAARSPMPAARRSVALSARCQHVNSRRLQLGVKDQ